jgi:hypothetical protein
MSETLTGDHKVETAYELEFGTDVDFKEICTKEYGRDELSKLSTAIEEDVSNYDYHYLLFYSFLNRC